MSDMRARTFTSTLCISLVMVISCFLFCLLMKQCENKKYHSSDLGSSSTLK
jgi:hypothetical protein